MDGGCFIDRELALNAEDTTRVEIDFGDFPRTNRNNRATQNRTTQKAPTARAGPDEETLMTTLSAF